jgi:hypothetical protein
VGLAFIDLTVSKMTGTSIKEFPDLVKKNLQMGESLGQNIRYMVCCFLIAVSY